MQHALCVAHLLRELENRVEGDDETWAKDLAAVLRDAIHRYHKADGQPLPPSVIDLIATAYDRHVAEGLAHHEALPPLFSKRRRGRKKRRPGHHLVLRLRDHRDSVLMFTTHPDVPPANNLAEQGVRPEKIQQKISDSFRSRSGATNCTIIRTVLATARKQGWNMLDTLCRSPRSSQTPRDHPTDRHPLRSAHGVQSQAQATASQPPRCTLRPVVIQHHSSLHV